MHTTSLESALESWRRIKAGERVIVSDDTLDVLSSHFTDAPASEDVNLFFYSMVTTGNPRRVGVRDQYIAFLPSLQTPEKLKELKAYAVQH